MRPLAVPEETLGFWPVSSLSWIKTDTAGRKGKEGQGGGKDTGVEKVEIEISGIKTWKCGVADY